MHASKLWSKNFIILSFINFLTHIVFYLLMTTVAMHVMKAYGASQSVAGLTTGIFVIAALIARFFTGIYLERIGRKRMLLIGLFIFAFSMVAYFVENSIGMIIVLRIIQGFTHGLITNAASAVVADIIPANKRGEGIGYYSTSMNIAMAIGPFLGIWISQYYNFELIVFIGSIVAILDFVAVLFLNVPENDTALERHKQKMKFSFRQIIELCSVPISTVMFAITLSYSSLLSFLSIYGESIKLETAASYFFIVYAIALVATRPITGKLFDLRGENFITYPLLIMLSLGFILLSQSQNSLMLLISAALIGISFGTLQSSFQTIAIQEADSSRTALATSTFWISLDLGSGLGPYLIGLLLSFVDYRNMYFSVGIWIILSIYFYYLAHGKKAAERKVPVQEYKQM